MTRWFRSPGQGAAPGQRRRAAEWAPGDGAWWHVLGYECGPPHCIAQVEQRFRRLAARVHPDRGGSPEQMQRLIRARAQARRQLSP